jgi:oligopeptide/dipeptide ABC transporter ATP-binding protein
LIVEGNGAIASTLATNRTGVESSDNVLEVDDLSVEYRTKRSSVVAIDHVSLRIGRGEIVGLVGESGCGKSTLAMSLLRLVPQPGNITGGRILFEGKDLLGATEKAMRRIRGAAISLVVQDALAVLNPVTTVGEQVGEVVRDHVGGSRREIRARARDTLRSVHLPNPGSNMERYPHELSGGMQQRVVIAEALILGPKLIVADEPTTALDVTVQAQILNLLREAREVSGAGVLFVTHDLAIVAEVCDRMLVMYAGKIVESGQVREVFRNPKHPYTQALLSCLLPLRGDPPAELKALGGSPPTPDDWPSGCRFNPRCGLREALGNPSLCVEEQPAPDQSLPHWAACHFADMPPQAGLPLQESG